jgi:DNA-binding MarR family transcriptional regulator
MPAKAYTKKITKREMKKPKTFGSFDSSLLDWGKTFMYLMHKTHTALDRHMDKTLHRKKGISFSQFLILLSISAKEEHGSSDHSPLHEALKDCDLSQSRLAEILQVTEASVSRHISILKRMMLVDATHSPRNRRTKVLTLTSLGETALMKAKMTLGKELVAISNRVLPKDRAALVRAHESIITYLS